MTIKSPTKDAKLRTRRYYTLMPTVSRFITPSAYAPSLAIATAVVVTSYRMSYLSVTLKLPRYHYVKRLT